MNVVSEAMSEIEAVFGSRLNPIIMTDSEFKSKIQTNLININELLKFDLLVKQDKTYKIRDRVVQDYLKTESEELGI
jgi:hypothetical protein